SSCPTCCSSLDTRNCSNCITASSSANAADARTVPHARTNKIRLIVLYLAFLSSPPNIQSGDSHEPVISSGGTRNDITACLGRNFSLPKCPRSDRTLADDYVASGLSER